MDKKSIIGLVLIVAIFMGFQYFNRPSQEQLAERKRVNDSIQNALQEQKNNIPSETIVQTTESVIDTLSNKAAKFGVFANVAEGTNDNLLVETDLFKLKFASKGGFLTYAELKKYKKHDATPLVLFECEKENSFALVFQTADNRVLSSKDMYFTALPIVEKDNKTTLTMRLNIDKTKYLDYIYIIEKDSYKINFDIVAHDMKDILAPMSESLDLEWNIKIKQQEKGRIFENRYVTLNYMYETDDIERLSERKDDEETASTPIMWFAAKDQFFSTILLNKNNFKTANLQSKVYEDEQSPYIKQYSVNTVIDFDPTGQTPTNLQLFLVPNQYKLLNRFNQNIAGDKKPNLQEIIPLGWVLFRWVSKYVIIPLFNLFSSFLSSWGLIILIVTVIIKVILLPLTFKSYMSTAKMKVLKPQLDAINEKIPADKPMERQQAQMKLYRSVGVSPMGGCLPMLLQMPILVAVFMYLPSAIELRQQSFLWATDLSTFDTVSFLSWNKHLPLIGDHLSIFCLLMTITNIIYTKINMQNQAGANQQMAMMKWMMYLMPLIFFFMFNNYASGLTYYYFISLLLTVLQTYLFRFFVDDDKLLQKLELAKQSKKKTKKSGFMARLEEAQKMQQKRMREKQKRK